MIIPLSGINMAESDYTTPDGSLDCAINAIPREAHSIISDCLTKSASWIPANVS